MESQLLELEREHTEVKEMHSLRQSAQDKLARQTADIDSRAEDTRLAQLENARRMEELERARADL